MLHMNDDRSTISFAQLSNDKKQFKPNETGATRGHLCGVT